MGVKSGGTEERVPCRKISGSSLEPFSGVEIHMEMDLEWKWMEMGTICKNVIDWFGFGGRPST